ncbi:hypothetical protein ACEWY4_006390 [Coilia grayii]|uniref:Uncharacterized protein n=1 Tax=Coilia grayii TaxID=363190 RepID=A0ABD1KDI9_9TELE
MRKKRPPEQVSVLKAVRSAPQAPEKLREKDSKGSNRPSGKGDSGQIRERVPAGHSDTEHCCGDRKQPDQSGPVPGKVVLLRRDLPTPADNGSSTTPPTTPTTKTPTRRLTPKKKVEWIPYTPAPSVPEMSSVWIYRARVKCTQPREPSPAPPIDQMKHLSLNEPLLPIDIKSPGAGEGSYFQGLRKPSWTENRGGTGSCGQGHWESGWSASAGQGEEAEARADSPDRGRSCYYSSAPASSGGMMPFRRKKSANRRPSVSWADDDYWASWDGWNEVIDWDDSEPPRRRGGRSRNQGKRNSHRWGNKGC